MPYFNYAEININFSSAKRVGKKNNNTPILILVHVNKLHDKTSVFDGVLDRSVFLCASLESHIVSHTAVVYSLMGHMVILLLFHPKVLYSIQGQNVSGISWL